MKEVSEHEDIPKAEFVFSRTFMAMRHNYLCAVCKGNPAVIETWHGILQPCWECQDTYKLLKLNWFDKLIGRGKTIK